MWPDSYLDASFRGVTFDCLSVQVEVQRATVAHSYPFLDGAEVEDLGLNAARYSLRAMLMGKDADARLSQLQAALDAPGPGELQHPVYGVLQVVVDSYRPAFEAESSDSVALDITFIEDAIRVHSFTDVIPEAQIEAVTQATDTASATGGDAYARQMRERLANANNSRLLQLADNLGRSMGQVAQFSRALQNTIQSYLDLPATLIGGFRAMLSALVPTISLPGSSALFPPTVSGYAAASARIAQATAFAPLPAGASAAVSGDAALMQSQAHLAAALTLAQAAQAVLAAELATPAATPPQIEAMTASVRAALQAQIDAQAALYPLETSRPVIEALKTTALQIQTAALRVIAARPPLAVKPAPVYGNYRLQAHALYGDHARAAELARLNPACRLPNFIAQGDALNAFDR